MASTDFISLHLPAAVAGLAAQEFMSPELDLFVSKDGTLDGRMEQDPNMCEDNITLYHTIYCKRINTR